MIKKQDYSHSKWISFLTQVRFSLICAYEGMIMKKLFAAFVLAALSMPVLATTSLKATVNGMVCAFCAQGIEKRLSKMPEAKAVLVDLKRRFVVVEPKEGMLLDEKLITAEIKDAGYDVVSIETLAKSVAEVRAETKAKK
jgi:mercuric ion binding protein